MCAFGTHIPTHTHTPTHAGTHLCKMQKYRTFHGSAHDISLFRNLSLHFITLDIIWHACYIMRACVCVCVIACFRVCVCISRISITRSHSAHGLIIAEKIHYLNDGSLLLDDFGGGGVGEGGGGGARIRIQSTSKSRPPRRQPVLNHKPSL